VDLDQTRVRVLEVNPSSEGPVLKWGASSIQVAEWETYRLAAITTLRELVEVLGIKRRKATVLLSGPSTAFLQMSLPPMPPQELKDAVRWSAQRALPFPLEEAILDYHLMEGKPGDQERPIVVAAVRRPFLMEQIDILQAAGLTPVHVSTLPMALGGIMQILKVRPEEPTLFIEVRPHVATLAFFRGRQLHLVRTSTPADTSAPENTDLLLNDIWLSLVYYQERFSGEAIQHIYLTGASVELDRLQPLLREAVGTSVERLSLTTVLPPSATEVPPPALAAALGTLLNPWRVNLLPAEVRYRRRMELVRTGARATAFALVGGLLAWSGIEAWAVSQQRQKIQEHRALIQRLTPVVEEIRTWEQMVASLSPRLSVYEEPLAQNLRWLGALKEFSALTPTSVSLTGVQPEGAQGIKVNGLVFEDTQEPELYLSEFIDRLSRSPYFGGVQLASSWEETGYPQRTLAFNLLLTWR
jgi:Tfp pilus assembly PilM family ATPase/Tfp pilus assembly protein PilN